jgi:tetratricopeptide (TPR) repeat protein
LLQVFVNPLFLNENILIPYPFTAIKFAQTASTYIQNGNARANAKDYKGAIQNFTQAIQLDDKNSEAYFYRANAYGNLKDDKAAIADYAKTLSLKSNLPPHITIKQMPKAMWAIIITLLIILTKPLPLSLKMPKCTSTEAMQNQILKIMPVPLPILLLP